MSRIIFATTGSLGDLHPYIAIARVLVKRGHQAVIASAAEYASPVERAGIEFAPVRPAMADLGDYQKIIIKIFNVYLGPQYLVRKLVMPYLRLAYEDLTRASKGADLLVSHPLTFTLQLVAQRNSLPWVSTILSPLSLMSNYDPPVLAPVPWLRNLRKLGVTPYKHVFNLIKKMTGWWEAPLRKFRRELGIEPSKHLAMFEGQFSRSLNLALFDPQLAKPQPDWPLNTHVCGSPVFDSSLRNDPSLEEMERFLSAGDPPIVFALGSSAVWIAGDFWKNALDAAQKLGRRAVLITGPETLTSLPDNVRAFSYLPYSKIFPRAAVVVHQAGIGTLAQALRSGRPQLIVPVAIDQPDNARRAEALGLARALPFAQANSKRLASELGPLLSQPSYVASSRAIAGELANTDGATCAANHLESCLDQH